MTTPHNKTFTRADNFTMIRRLSPPHSLRLPALRQGGLPLYGRQNHCPTVFRSSPPQIAQGGFPFERPPAFTEKPFIALPFWGHAKDLIGHSALPSISPVAIFGPSGVGKSHFLGQVARKILVDHPEKKIAYFSFATFQTLFTRAVEEKKVREFSVSIDACDAFIVDDIGFLQGPEIGTQIEMEFFELMHRFIHDRFNAFRNAVKIVLITVHTHPHTLRMHQRLTSRFLSGYHHHISLPEPNDLCLALIAKAQQRGIKISPDRAASIAARCTPDLRDIESVVNLLEIERTADIGQDSVEQFLRNLKPHPPQFPIAQTLLDWIARKIKVPVEHLTQASGKRHKEEISFGRHVFCYLMKNKGQWQNKDIGTILGIHHSTVMYAVKQMEKKVLAKDPVVLKFLQEFERDFFVKPN